MRRGIGIENALMAMGSTHSPIHRTSRSLGGAARFIGAACLSVGLACSAGSTKSGAGAQPSGIAGGGLGGMVDAQSGQSGGPAAGAGGKPPTEFTWSTATPCPLSRFEANGAVIGGELWVMGGFTASNLEVTKRIDIYDPEQDNWRLGPELPGAETHFAVVAIGNDIIVAGGFTGGFGNGRPPPTDAVFRWQAALSQWVAGPSLPNPGAAFAGALLGTRLHLAGGLFVDGNTDSPYQYVWDTAAAATWTSAAELMNPRNHGGRAASGGIFYAIAGRHQWDEGGGDVADVDAYDPETDAWTARAPIPTGRSEIAASTSTMNDGRILVIGGSLNGVMPSDDVLVYDPHQNAWSTLPKLPEKRKGAVAVPIDKRVIVTTGSPTSTDPIATTFVGCCL